MPQVSLADGGDSRERVGAAVVNLLLPKDGVLDGEGGVGGVVGAVRGGSVVVVA